MKKNLFILAAAAVALASCSSDDLISENAAAKGGQPVEIALNPVSQAATRAASSDPEYNAVEGVAFPKNYDMKVVAYSVPETGTAGNYFGSTTANGAPLFGFKYAGGAADTNPNEYWGGKSASDVQYWPLSPATLNFLAVTNNGSPTADVVSETFDTDYASGVTVTLADNKPQDATEGKGQHDLMYACGRAEVSQSGNALNIPKKVDMTFNHALAWVVFRVKAGNTAAAGISIKEIRLNGANYGGTFQAKVDNYNVKASGAALAFNDATTKWTAADVNADDIASPNMTLDKDGDGNSTNDSKAIETADFTQIGDGIMVVPTSELTSTVSMTSFEIDYYLNKNLYTYTFTPATDGEKTFAKGKKYIFDITMTLSEIFVNPSVADWEVAVTNYVDIPTFEAGTTGRTFNIPAAAGTYYFRVAGFAGNTAPTVGGTYSTNITGATAEVVNYNSGTATVKVVVPKNTSSAKDGTITLTDAGTGADASKDTSVTVNQAGI